MLFIGLSDTIEVVSTADPRVTPHDGVPDGWLPRWTDQADVGKGAHVFKVRPLNGREMARVFNAQNLERLYTAAEIAVVDIQPPVVDQLKERLTIREAVGHLDIGGTGVAGLFAVIDALTHGIDPFAKEEAGAAPAPKSDP